MISPSLGSGCFKYVGRLIRFNIRLMVLNNFGIHLHPDVFRATLRENCANEDNSKQTLMMSVTSDVYLGYYIGSCCRL